MPCYYHCVPGRMRVKIPLLKNRRRRGAEVAGRLRGIEGVDAVTFSDLTGSLVLTFDPDRFDPAQAIRLLKKLKLYDEKGAVSHDEHVQHAVSQAGARVGKAVLGWAVGRTLESSGLGVLAALI